MSPAPCPRNRSRRPSRTLAVAASAAALGMLLAGCGGDENDPFDDVDTSRPSGSASASAAAPAPQTSLTASPNTKIPSAGKKVEAATLATRISAAAKAKKSLKFDLITQGTGAMGGNGVAEGTGSASRVQARATMSGGEVQIVKNGSDVYFKSPSPVGGKPWLKIVQNSNDPFSRIYTQVFYGLQQSADVPETAKAIAKMGTFKESAQEQVDGVATTKYMAAPKPSAGVLLLPPAYQALNPEQLTKAKTTVSLWVDAESLLRRSTVVFELEGVQSTQTLVSYRDWGRPITVTPPPASQVVSGAQLTSP